MALPTERFAVVRQLVPAEIIARVRTFLESEVRPTVEPILGELGLAAEEDLRESIASQGIGLDQYRSLSETSRKGLTGQFRLEARLSEVLHEIPRSTQVHGLLKRVLGSEKVFMHLPPVARFVYPKNQMAWVPAHRDVVYNGHLSDFLVMWVPLVPIDDLCGGVEFFPEVGLTSIDVVDLDPDKPWLSPVSTGTLKGVHPAMEPGDVLLFDRHVVHQSVGNASDRTRLSIDFRFFGEYDSSTKSFLDLNTGEATHPEAQ